MLIVSEFTGARKKRVAEALTIEEARDVIASFSQLVCFEEDEEYPTCADAFTVDGRIWTVEPAEFRLEHWQ